MSIKRPKLFAKKCTHQSSIVVRSTGMERTVCEDCGHISFAFFPDEQSGTENIEIALTPEHKQEKAS